MKTKKILIWITVSVAVVGLGGYFFASKEKEVEYITEDVKMGNIRKTISVTGEVVSKRRLDIAPEVGGYVEDVYVKVGDEVQAGQKIASIDASILIEQLKESRANLRIQEENEKLARRGWKKIKPEEREAKIEATNQARYAVSTIESRIAKTNIFAPESGIISAVNFEKGENAIASNVMFTIIDPNDLEFEADIPESDISEIKVGQNAEVDFDAFDESETKARVSQIYPAANIIQDVVYYKTKFDMFAPESEEIKSGMSVDLDILVFEKNDVLVVSEQSIDERDNGNFITVLKDNGEVEEREVTIGESGDDSVTEVISGLSVGEKVVVLTEEK